MHRSDTYIKMIKFWGSGCWKVKRSELDGLGQMRVPEVVFPELHAIPNLSEKWEEEESEGRKRRERRDAREKKKTRSWYSRIPGMARLHRIAW